MGEFAIIDKTTGAVVKDIKAKDGILMVNDDPQATIQTELVPITQVNADAVHKSDPKDVSAIRSALVMIDHGRIADNAFVTEATEYLVQVSQQASGDDTWRTLTSVACMLDDPVAIATDALEAVGQTVIECGAVLPTVGDLVFFWNSGTPAESEWAKIIKADASVGTENFTILDGLRYQHAAGNYYNKAEQFLLALDLDAATRLRVVCNNARLGTNQNIAYRAALLTAV